MVGWFFHSHSPPRLLIVVGVGKGGLNASDAGNVVVDFVVGVVGVVVVDFHPSGNIFTSA